MKPVQATSPHLTSGLVLEVFDMPITFHRCLVRVTGSVTAALMLSQAMAWTDALAPEVDGWFSSVRAIGPRKPGSRDGSRRPPAGYCATVRCWKSA